MHENIRPWAELRQRSNLQRLCMAVSASLFVLSAPIAQAGAVVLYNQNFEKPVGFVDNGGDVNALSSVNQLYPNQPQGFTFAQQFTVETLRVGGTQAWAAAQGGKGGFKDPQGIAGSYVLGMLSSRQDDLLGLAFNVGNNHFLNFRLNISSIDLNAHGGPFVPTGGQAPVFRLSLFDNPSGQAGIGGGKLLDSEDITGLVAPNKWTFNWSELTVALDAIGNTNGNVLLQIDLLKGGYAALDNLRIAASNEAGNVGTVNEPAPLLLAALGLAALGWQRRRKIA
ncbi:MYXO-CTERM domain-containing protein [Chitinivorax tropicus]|uniref:MYXO-CTERM domain-containing protein n=1 Tax=Chitinivorax tropicus TaxID=714531 RepID=A0A840MJQ2_9PROT|nr:hypothetical protein [Chitinivorax tropicus]MBB5016922.1 MYXO-CTERM domain-containing protein [Chitinivorax tropicus]